MDDGVKVFSIPVSVLPPRPEGGPEPSPIHSQVLGLCGAGSPLNVYSVAEILRDMLQAVYIVPSMTSFTMDDICRVVESFFQNISRRVCRALAGPEGGAVFLLAGYCRERQDVRTYRLDLDVSGFPIRSICTELDLGAGPVCIGSGAPAARTLLSSKRGLRPLEVLKAVILDDGEPTVGGCVQFGRFDGKDFRTFGVEDYFLHEDGSLDVGMYVRGVKVFNSPLQESWGLVTPRRSFVLPYRKEIDELLEAGHAPYIEE